MMSHSMADANELLHGNMGDATKLPELLQWRRLDPVQFGWPPVGLLRSDSDYVQAIVEAQQRFTEKLKQ